VPYNPLEWLKVARTIDRLLTLETKRTSLLEARAKEIQSLKDRPTRLEAREEIVVARAKGAAAAASVVASQHIAGLARHMGTLDERTRQLQRLLPQ
jgi:hypothetical protein